MPICWANARHSPPNDFYSRCRRFLDRPAVLTEVLARPGSLAVIDDGPGRTAARALGLPLTGTLDVLIRARRLGRLLALAPIIRELKAVGIFLPNDNDLRKLLGEFNETWP